MTLIEQLAAFVAAADAATLPAGDRAILRCHLADAVVARIAGARAHEGRAVAALAPRKRRDASAVALMAATVRLTEIDDIHLASCTTPSSVAVPVALGLAAEHGCDPARLTGALWASTELMVRLGKAIDGARVLYQGIWPTRVGAPLAAAAAGARIRGLDAGRTAHALSLALMMTPTRSGRFTAEPSGRWILFAAAVGDGIRAAEAARAGFTGDLTLLDGPWLEGLLGAPVDLARLGGGLGRSSVYPELSLKPYCTSRQALAATEAMRQLLADGLDPAEILSVRVRVPSAYAGMIAARLDPAVRASSYVSAGAQLAIAALAPAHLHDVDRAQILKDPRVAELAARVRVEADPALDRHFPERWPAAVEVETGAGRRSCTIIDATGDPARRLDDAGLLAKARAVLAHLGLEEEAETVTDLAWRAEFDEAACEALADVFVRASAAEE